MTREGREYRRRRRERSDDEIREDVESKESYNPEKCVREAIKEIQEEEAERLRAKEQQEKNEVKEKAKVSEEYDVDRCVREAIQEVQLEEQERQRRREEREKVEMEKEQQREASREVRKESAEKDNLEDYEEEIKKAYERYGIDPERVEERWREKFEEEVKQELEDNRESEKESEEKEDRSAGQERTADGRSYYDDGSGQVYEVRMDSKESSSADTEVQQESPEVQEEPKPEVREKQPESEVKEGTVKESEVREVREQDAEVEEQKSSEKTKESPRATPEETAPQETKKESKEVPKKRVEQSTIDEYTVEESKVEEPEKVHEEKEPQKVENPAPSETREVQEDSVEEEVEVRPRTEEPEVRSGEVQEEEFEDSREEVVVNEDLERFIEELLEELIVELTPEEAEEVDESRIIVDSMTGRKYIDRTYEYRPYHEKNEEETAEQKRINLRKRLAELFGELSEEEREKFKEKHRPLIETVEDLDDLIEKNRAVRASPDFKEKLKKAREYLRSGKQGEVPRLIRELQRDEVERAWSEFVFHRLVLAFARRLNSAEKTKESMKKESAESTGYAINMWTPELDGERIESYDHLVEVLRSRSPAFFKRKDAEKLLKSARLHIELYLEYGGRTHLERGEVAALSKKLGKSPTTLKRYLRQGVMPKVYYWSNMVTSEDKEKKLEELLARLNGVTTEVEYDKRFGTLYFSDERSTTSNHKAYDESARKFFEFIREYMESGLLVDLAKRLKIGKSTIGAWFDGTQLPTRVAYASLIPQESPRAGWKWLPRRLNTKTNLPEDFIQVPVEISSPQDILDVLNQIVPLDSKAMEAYEKELGEMSQEIAFMYLLGLMVSDGTFDFDTDYSANAELYVSKKYSWGSTLGKGFCYTLGKIGLSAKRRPDYEKVRENGKVSVFRVYDSTASPVLMWMKKALLGLSASETKKEVAIKSDWILEMPYDWKVAFIQGLTDGDGHASIPRFDTAIATITNKKFFKNLLASIGIESRFTDHHVKIGKYDEIVKAKELPFFRFASGRQETLNDICKIISLRPKGRQPIPENEKRLVMELYRAGLSKGEIVERLWYKHGLARTMAMVDTLIRRENKKMASEQ